MLLAVNKNNSTPHLGYKYFPVGEVVSFYAKRTFLHNLQAIFKTVVNCGVIERSHCRCPCLVCQTGERTLKGGTSRFVCCTSTWRLSRALAETPTFWVVTHWASPPESGGVRSEYQAASRMVSASMLARASAGVR